MMVSVFLLVLLSVGAICLPAAQAQLPEDCHDVYKNGSTQSGLYTIYPPESTPVEVYCDMDCEDKEDKGGWTVIQSRSDGNLNFHRPWDQYKSGFGNISGEHWLGLENIFAITWQKKYRLRVDMEDFEGGTVHAEYSSFSLDPESDGYRLNLGDYIDGGAGDSLSTQRGMRFATFDKDLDGYYNYYPYYYYYYNYYGIHSGGFWFSYYDQANPNGLYLWGSNSIYQMGVIWNTWKGPYYSLKAITMKIRPVSLHDIKN
ncbi:microfibril-associated glycoprotein 4-like [Anguilla rostrata]|uniref:microfibril-associated glycoprotein 4-like n=1 Tax=Anguilla rostrata TaxID=7938 RepID=UPI0030CD43C1